MSRGVARYSYSRLLLELAGIKIPDIPAQAVLPSNLLQVPLGTTQHKKLHLTVGQDGPYDSHVFVRDRNEGLVVTDSTVQIDDPLLEPRAFEDSRFRATCNVERAPWVSSPRR
jgi:hypothetical protein